MFCDPYFGQAAAQMSVENVGRSFSMMMMVLLIAFTINILLVLFRRYTKVRTLFITGHQQMVGIFLVSKLAKKIGNPKNSLENLKLPGFLSIFNENVVATGILMFFFFGAIISILGPELMHKIDQGFGKNQNFLFYILEKSLNFAVYLTILQLGVRMFVSELTNSFQGISEKILPGSVPAVDCAATYGFGHPNAVTFGFLFGAFGQFLAIIGLIVNNFQFFGAAAVVLLLLAVPQLLYRSHKDTYFVIAEDYEKYKEIEAKKQGVPVEDVVIE